MSIWFAVSTKGTLYNLCDCGDEEAARQSAEDLMDDDEKVDALLDEELARQWFAILMAGITMNQGLKLDAPELPGLEGEPNRFWVRLDDRLDLLVNKTHEGYILDVLQPYADNPDTLFSLCVWNDDLEPETTEAEDLEEIQTLCSVIYEFQTMADELKAKAADQETPA